MGKSDSFSILKKILIISKDEKTGHFWTHNQHFFFLNSLDFSEILPDDKHQKMGKNDSFAHLRKSYIVPKTE